MLSLGRGVACHLAFETKKREKKISRLKQKPCFQSQILVEQPQPRFFSILFAALWSILRLQRNAKVRARREHVHIFVYTDLVTLPCPQETILSQLKPHTLFKIHFNITFPRTARSTTGRSFWWFFRCKIRFNRTKRILVGSDRPTELAWRVPLAMPVATASSWRSVSELTRTVFSSNVINVSTLKDLSIQNHTRSHYELNQPWSSVCCEAKRSRAV
jgi:hypothetical protein